MMDLLLLSERDALYTTGYEVLLWTLFANSPCSSAEKCKKSFFRALTQEQGQLMWLLPQQPT